MLTEMRRKLRENLRRKREEKDELCRELERVNEQWEHDFALLLEEKVLKGTSRGFEQGTHFEPMVVRRFMRKSR